ncbi:MAG TPA: hypothetical protein VGF25_12790 [Thermoleophilaceae bacterium]
MGRLTALVAGAAIAAALLVPSVGPAAPGDPPCAADKTLAVTFSASEAGAEVPLVATHEVQLLADWPGDVRNPSLSVPAGVRVLGRAPRKLRLVVPARASLPVTASWEQATDPADPDADPSDPATRCVATRTVQVPVQSPLPSRPFYDLPAGEAAWSTFAVVPDQRRGDPSPLEVLVRVSTAARFPSAGTRARRMPVAMRPSERVHYRKRIPHEDLLTFPKLCRFYYLTCGPSRLYTEVSALPERGPGRITKRDLTGGELLSRPEPFRKVAPYGVKIRAFTYTLPGHEPRALGYDIQVRQSGRLVGRVRRAARCSSKPNRYDVKVFRCKVVRRKNG